MKEVTRSRSLCATVLGGTEYMLPDVISPALLEENDGTANAEDEEGNDDDASREVEDDDSDMTSLEMYGGRNYGWRDRQSQSRKEDPSH